MAKKRALMGCPRKKQEDFMRKRHKQLERDGWLRQFVADEAQAKDAVEIYDLLGYEVYLQPPKPSLSKKENLPLQRNLKDKSKLSTSGLKNHPMMRKTKGPRPQDGVFRCDFNKKGGQSMLSKIPLSLDRVKKEDMDMQILR